MKKLNFADSNKNNTKVDKDVYKVLIVDDDESVHTITNLALKSIHFKDFIIETSSVYSAKEAKAILALHNDFALALVDVVMETDAAGLELVDFIRNDLENSLIRLVIRTGQANIFSSMEVIERYDINDFKEKTELSIEGLFITIRSAIREYIQLRELLNDIKEQRLALDSHAIVAITDVQGKISFVNRMFEKISGYSRDELIGENHRILNSGLQPSSYWKEMYDTVVRGDTWRDIVCNKAKDGSLYWVDTSIFPFMNNDGKPQSYIAIRTDVTEQKKQDKIMMQQSRLAQMGEMISMIAHQWRQPLGAIASTALDLKCKIELESFDVQTKEGIDVMNHTFIENLSQIESFTHNLSSTIDDFRNFYVSDKKSISISFKEVVSKALAIVRSSLVESNIEILEEYDDELLLTMKDNEMLQVVLNILKNSQDNFNEKLTVEPKIKITTRGTSLQILDNGGGIEEEVMDKIYDPYFSTKNEKNGTGLGLYMSKIIIEGHHNGKLSAYNFMDGVCFEVQLKRQSL